MSSKLVTAARGASSASPGSHAAISTACACPSAAMRNSAATHRDASVLSPFLQLHCNSAANIGHVTLCCHLQRSKLITVCADLITAQWPTAIYARKHHAAVCMMTWPSAPPEITRLPPSPAPPSAKLETRQSNTATTLPRRRQATQKQRSAHLDNAVTALPAARGAKLRPDEESPSHTAPSLQPAARRPAL